MNDKGVCIIIAARNAQATIGRAVRSALAEPEVTEVAVIDDASTDATAELAQHCDDGSGRLQVQRLTSNLGPSAARNAALASTSAPYVAILDADDFLLPGRFARLLAEPGWDLAADNIVFLPEGRAADPKVDTGPVDFERIDVAEFARGNLESAVSRGELGFLKPLMSRDFLDRHQLRYDESMWLGEDYDLYMRMLLRGARFVLTRQVGYAAIVRPGSLSGRHRTGDLKELAAASRRHLAQQGLGSEARREIARHARQTEAKHLLRAFLDCKSEKGLAAAAGYALWPPHRAWPVVSGIARDKYRDHFAPVAKVAPVAQRLLLQPKR